MKNSLYIISQNYETVIHEWQSIFIKDNTVIATFANNQACILGVYKTKQGADAAFAGIIVRLAEGLYNVYSMPPYNYNGENNPNQ